MRFDRRWMLAAGATLMAACSEPTPVASVDALPSTALAAAAQRGPHTIDAEFAAIAERVPGFGGAYFDASGNLVAWLTDSKSEDAARAELGPLLVSRARSYGAVDASAKPRIVFEKAAYDWRQLREWSQRLVPLLGQPGIVYTDIDERRNRVVVAVDGSGVASRASAELAAQGIPAGAVIVETVNGFEFAATLLDSTKTTVGAMQIIANGGKVCTIGFNTVGQGGLFIVPSHCTNVPGGTELTNFYTVRVDPGAIWLNLGGEYMDPAYFSGFPCPPGRLCRYSDAASAMKTIWAHLGFTRIHRTMFPGALSGSTTIDPVNPSFFITADNPWPMTGEVLEKIGRTSGWTYGSVSNTCINVNVAFTNMTFLCQSQVTSGAQIGDSGAPVFRRLVGSSVELYGILSTRDPNGTSYTFSPVNQIIYELGPQSTH